MSNRIGEMVTRFRDPLDCAATLLRSPVAAVRSAKAPARQARFCRVARGFRASAHWT